MITHLIKYQLIDSKLEPYNLKYSLVFSTIKDLISQLFPEVEIEHIGSTAIPDPSGKQIIDILIPCKKLDFTDSLTKLKKIGFQHTPFSNIPEDRPMLVAGINFKDKFYNIHVHLTPKNSDVHLDNIYFREQLKQNFILAKEYERIKQNAVNSDLVEATEYNLAKIPFIQSVINKRKNSKSDY